MQKGEEPSSSSLSGTQKGRDEKQRGPQQMDFPERENRKK